MFTNKADSGVKYDKLVTPDLKCTVFVQTLWEL